MAARYIWQQRAWPSFSWDSSKLLTHLGQARQAQGRIISQAESIGLEASANLIVEEAFATAAIEGENLDRNTIRSSVARRLGLPRGGLPAEQRHVDGLVEMLLDATMNFTEPLTPKRLHGWHAALFPTGYSGIHEIVVGHWRKSKEPMRVISGAIGGEKIHYEAPPSSSILQEMKGFLNWWAHPTSGLDGLLRAGIAHFWFVSIHPYGDGNGRISRAITEMALSQDEDSKRRLYNLSAQILAERNAYYNILEETQKGSGDLTGWLKWFLEMYVRAIGSSKDVIQSSFIKASFWRLHSKTELNQRQIKVVEKMLDAEPLGFEGGINNRKYVSMTGASRESAKRDLSDLDAKGILKRNEGGGRSTSYSLDKSKL